MNNIAPGVFEDGYVVWNKGKEWVFTKGYQLQTPDLSTSDADRWIAMEGCIRRILGCIGEDEKVQVILKTESNFEEEIGRFERCTLDNPVICQELREKIALYFRNRMNTSKLIRSSVYLYLSKSVKQTRRSAFDEVFAVIKRAFEQRHNYFDTTLRVMGGSAISLNDEGHYLDLLDHFSPGQSPVKDPDFTRSVNEICRYGDISHRSNTENGFYTNGYFVGVYAVKKMPRLTWQKSIEPFFNLSIPGLRVCVNIMPLSASEEIRREDDKYDTLGRNKLKPSIIAGMNQHVGRAERLQSNDAVPFKAQIIITIRDKSKDALDDKMEGLKSVIDFVGFQGFRSSLPITAIAFYNCSTPGYGQNIGYDYWHRIDDDHLSHLVPFGATPTAQLSKADWVMCNNRNGMMGGKLFFGSQAADGVILGTKGAGKSSTAQSIILQACGAAQDENSEKRIQYLAVVDNGKSWIETCKLLDPTCKPIIVRSRSGHTFNPLDTKGLAKSSEHLRSAVALVELLVGYRKDEDQQADRSDIISNTIKDIYHRDFLRWKNEHPDLYYKACKRTLIALRTINMDFVDAVQWIKEMETQDPNKVSTLENAITKEDAALLNEDNSMAHFIEDYAFSTFTPDMFPRLSDLWEELNAKKRQKGASPHCEGLANRLKRWLANGEYGPLVDGISNVDLGTPYITKDSPLKVVYFEMADMKESEHELRSVIGFLITNELRNVIQTMPRGIRKACIIEEVTAFLSIPNADKILKDFSERFRKYSCLLIYIFQQYLSLLKADASVAEAILGNCQLMWLLRNVNRKELDTLNEHLVIPEPIKDVVQSFPMPEDLRGKLDAYAGGVYVVRTGHTPTFTIFRNIISSKMEQIVESSGDRFEEKMNRLIQKAA